MILYSVAFWNVLLIETYFFLRQFQPMSSLSRWQSYCAIEEFNCLHTLCILLNKFFISFRSTPLKFDPQANAKWNVTIFKIEYSRDVSKRILKLTVKDRRLPFLTLIFFGSQSEFCRTFGLPIVWALCDSSFRAFL